MRPCSFTALLLLLFCVSSRGGEANYEEVRKTNSIENKSPEITEISLKRTGYALPHSTITFTSTGKVQCVLTDVPERSGLKAGPQDGTIQSFYFNQVAWFIRSCGFLRMDDDYGFKGGGPTDQEDISISVVADGDRKTIHEYGGTGPRDLWVIQQLIEKLKLQTKWDNPTPTPTRPTK